MSVKVSATFETPPAAPAVPQNSAGRSFRTVVNPTIFGPGDLTVGLRNSILRQMGRNPELFASELVRDASTRAAYAKDFADHMLDKLSREEVKVLNETSVEALKYIKDNFNNAQPISLKGMYDYVFSGGKPKHKTDMVDVPTPRAAPLKPKFKGC